MLRTLLPTYQQIARSGYSRIEVDCDTFLKNVKLRHEMLRPREQKDILLTQYRFTYHLDKLYIEGRGGEVYRLHPLVERQILSNLGVETKFREFCPENFHLALNEAINRHPWFRTQKIARVVDGDNGAIIRALVSNSYGFLDDMDWIPEVLKTLQEDKDNDWYLSHIDVNDLNTHIRVSTKKTDSLRVGDVVQKSIDLRNSEVAQGGLRVQYLYHILRCQNGMTSESNQDMLTTTHRGSEKVTHFKEMFKYIIEMATNGGWEKIRQIYVRAGDIDVSEEEALDIIAESRKALGLTTTMSANVQQEFRNNPLDLSLFAVSQAFSRVAQDYENYEDRFLLEKSSGRLLNPLHMRKIHRKDMADRLVLV